MEKELFEKIYTTIFYTRSSSPLHELYYSMEFNLKNCPLDSKEVLDLGCGAGIFSLYAALVANARKVYALDEFEGHGNPSKNYERFRSQIKKYNLSDIITLIKANGVTYNFVGQTFDVIYCSNVLHHIFPKNKQNNESAIMAFFSKLKDLLRPKGKVIVQEVMRHNITEFLPRRFNSMGVDWKTKRNASEWAYLFKQAGFREVKSRYYTPMPFRHMPFRLFTDNTISSFMFLSRYVLECR